MAMRPYHMFLLTVTIFLWSGYYVAGKFALALFPPFFINFLRFALVALLVLPWAGWPKMPFRQIATLALLLGVLNFGLGLAAMGWGLDIPTTIIIAQLSVPLSCVFGSILLNDKLDAWRSSGLVVAMLGAVFIAGTPNVTGHYVAFITMLVAATSWALANILMKKYGEVKIFPFLGALSLLSAFPLLALSLLFEQGQLEALSNMGWKEAGGVIYLGLGATLGAYGLWYYLLHRYVASQITSITMVAPFVSFALAWLFFDQQISLQVMIAGVVTMIGVAMITLRKPRIAMLGIVNVYKKRSSKKAVTKGTPAP